MKRLALALFFVPAEGNGKGVEGMAVSTWFRFLDIRVSAELFSPGTTVASQNEQATRYGPSWRSAKK